VLAGVLVLLTSISEGLELRPGEHVLDVAAGDDRALRSMAEAVGPTGLVTAVCRDGASFARLRAAFESEPATPIVIRRTSGAGLWMDAAATDVHLAQHPLRSADDVARFRLRAEACRSVTPLITSGSVKVVVAKGPFSFVRREERLELISEMYRVLASGGRVSYTDVATDENVGIGTETEANLLLNGFGGALREDEMLAAFENAGFYGVTLNVRDDAPLSVVGNIELRRLVVSAWRGKEGPCMDQRHAVVYKGPFRQVEDDDGHVLRRGERMAVCEKTFRIFSNMPYRPHVSLVEPRELVPIEEAPPFPCALVSPRRTPEETKRVSKA
jgi:arsenite methyltransferase